MSQKETIVMSVGGSLIVPGEIDTTFLAQLKAFIIDQTTNYGRFFIIIPGGGKTSRRYGAALKEFTSDDTAIDRMGIAACTLNGELLEEIFKDNPNIQVRPDPELYQPGGSSDCASVRTAIKHEAKKAINLSNISHVYTADPNTDPAAKKIEAISWSEFRQIIPAEFSPNLSCPFDPEAAKLAEEHDIEVATIHGSRLDEVANYLDGETFVGTVIS